ncbi:MAG: chemotaxis protein CheW [Anaerolineae bacterium]
MSERSDSQGIPCILFTLADATYAVRSDQVQQMQMIEAITPVPNAPPFVDGVVFSRGQVIPVINLRARLRFPRQPYDLHSRLIVVQSGGRLVGLAVDSAREFAIIPQDAIKPPPEIVAGLSGRYLTGIARLGERLILLIDVEQVLDLHDLQAIAGIGETKPGNHRPGSA